MCVNLNWFLFLNSPLEQFEISSFNTSLKYTTTSFIDLLESNFFYKESSFYNIIDLIFFAAIIKTFFFFFKQNGFFFLYIFLLILLMGVNLYAFTDFVIYNGVFNLYLEGAKNINVLNAKSYLYRDQTITAHHYWTLIDWLNAFPIILKENDIFLKYNLSAEGIADLADIFYINSFIPNMILNINILVGYSWLLGYLIYKGMPLNESFDGIPIEMASNGINKLVNISSKWISGGNINWTLLFQDKDFIYFKNVFLPQYINHIDSIKDMIRYEKSNAIIKMTEFDVSLGSTFFGWAILIIVIVGIFLASKPYLFGLDRLNEQTVNWYVNKEFKNLYLTTVDTCSTGQCPIEQPSTRNILNLVKNIISESTYKTIVNYILKVSYKVYPEIFTMDAMTTGYIMQPGLPYLLERAIIESRLDLDFMKKPLFVKDLMDGAIFKNNYSFITINSSFINIYSVFFCFIFIYMIIYLLYNKSISNNTNNIFPNIYQSLGENIYKIGLNLFYSVLGKHLTHPEFFIKIITIFIFLIISNVQGMIPYMSTLTSALTNTFFIALALFISIIITLFDKKGYKYFLNLFMPAGCPIFLVLLLIPIEIISYSFRVVSLSVRLFANMMAGHTLLKVIVGFSWIIVFLGNTFLINLFPIIILFILTLLEFGVALIQSYIFTILSCIYLRDIFQGH